MAVKVNDVTDFLGITNTRAKDPVAPSKPSFDPEVEGERKVLYEWDTVTRVQPKMVQAPKINRSIIIIGALIALLLIAMQEFLLVAVVASLIFVRYILSATPGRDVHHKLTNHGIDYSGQFYYWSELTQYYFMNTGGQVTLCVDTKERLPGRLYLLLKPGDQEKVKEIVGKYLTFLQESPTSFIDKMYDNAIGRIKLDQ